MTVLQVVSGWEYLRTKNILWLFTTVPIVHLNREQHGWEGKKELETLLGNASCDISRQMHTMTESTFSMQLFEPDLSTAVPFHYQRLEKSAEWASTAARFHPSYRFTTKMRDVQKLVRRTQNRRPTCCWLPRLSCILFKLLSATLNQTSPNHCRYDPNINGLSQQLLFSQPGQFPTQDYWFIEEREKIACSALHPKT